MKKIFISLAVVMAALLANAQESATSVTRNADIVEAPATFFGETVPVVEIRGSSWLNDWTSLGWSVGTYSNAPEQISNCIYVYNYSIDNIQIQPGSKLILKVNGQPMVLTTAQGTFYPGSTQTYLRYSDAFLQYVNYYETSAFYEVTQEQADLINKYGISKYRYQVDGNVYERDNMNAAKIARKMSRTYDRLASQQLKFNRDINDLSDF